MLITRGLAVGGVVSAWSMWTQAGAERVWGEALAVVAVHWVGRGAAVAD